MQLEELKEWLVEQPLKDLIRAWRFMSDKDPRMQGQNGRYFARFMRHKQNSNPLEWAWTYQEMTEELRVNA